LELGAGSILGSYEIVGPLGAGAMGAVYRARDPRLGRDVAIKVVSERALLAPHALERFEQEARAASAIAHPNIVTVHEIGTFDATPFIVMELVDGKSLRALLSDGPLPLKTLLTLAVQVADGLAAAHACGIVHRDVKPENIMVTPRGVVKILDFGIARATMPSGGPGDSTLTSPLRMTEPGTIVGTASYMSPEQARGSDVDFRTDQFSLGSVLYEMATGRVAFRRDSVVETLTAILREEPPPIRDLAPASPAPLRWIVERCLAKDREGRWDSTQDLARELHSLKDHASEIGSAAVAGVEAPAARTRGPGIGWLAATGVLAVVALASGFLATKWHAPRPLPTFKRLTFQRGNVTGARFAPDGQTVIYSAAWEGRPSEIFSTHLSGPGARSLGISPAQLAGVSGTGEIAFRFLPETLMEDLAWSAGTLATAPLSGGEPHEIREWVIGADISRDGKSVAVVMFPKSQNTDQGTLEFPLGTPLATGQFNFPRISPDGRQVAFVDGGLDGNLAIAVVDREGKRRTLSKGWRLALSPVWSPKGDEVWFTAGNEGFPQTLFAVDLKGRTRELLRIPPIAFLEDVSQDGRALVRRLDNRKGILCRPPGAAAERDLSWFDYSDLADLSRDGKLLLFTESGGGTTRGSTYVRGTDGSPATRLGEGHAAALSPDAKWAVTVNLDVPSKIQLLPVGAGQPRPFDLAPTEFFAAAGWSREGERLYFWGLGPDRARGLFELTLSTGLHRRIDSVKGGLGGSLSPDATKVVACEEAFSKCAVFPLDGGPGRAIPGREEYLLVVGWAADGRSIYVSDPHKPAKISRVRLEDGHSEFWKELRPADAAGACSNSSVVISPETGAYAYSYTRGLSDLYLVEGLK
jgi:eukaryotic-like serine/threonine-protein kinase